MRVSGSFLIGLAVLTTLAMASVDADCAELIERMKAGGHILMIRHALAPGSSDPANFKIGDCATQRNLDDGGRQPPVHRGPANIPARRSHLLAAWVPAGAVLPACLHRSGAEHHV